MEAAPAGAPAPLLALTVRTMLTDRDSPDWLLRLMFGALAVLLATVAMAVHVAWPYADNMVKVGHGVAYYETATLVAPDRVRLPDQGETVWPGRFELAWDGGYGEMGPIVSRGDGFVVRTFTARQGALAPGTPVRVDTYYYEGDP